MSLTDSEHCGRKWEFSWGGSEFRRLAEAKLCLAFLVHVQQDCVNSESATSSTCRVHAVSVIDVQVCTGSWPTQPVLNEMTAACSGELWCLSCCFVWQLVMTGVWVTVEILMLIFFIDLPSLTDAEAKGISSPEGSINPDTSSSEDCEKAPLVGPANGQAKSYGTGSGLPSPSINADVPSDDQTLSKSTATPPPSWKTKFLGMIIL